MGYFKKNDSGFKPQNKCQLSFIVQEFFSLQQSLEFHAFDFRQAIWNTRLCFHLLYFFSVFHTLHSSEDDGCAPLQFKHLDGDVGREGVGGRLVQGPSYSRTYLGHTAAELYLWALCPYFWHLKQRSGLGINGSTFTLKYPVQISFGRLPLRKVRNKVFVSFSWPWSFLLTRLTNVTPCSLNSSHMSVSVMPARLRQPITPCEEFRVGRVQAFMGLSTNFWDLRRRSLCFFCVTLHQKGSISESLETAWKQGLETFVNVKWW